MIVNIFVVIILEYGCTIFLTKVLQSTDKEKRFWRVGKEFTAVQLHFRSLNFVTKAVE